MFKASGLVFYISICLQGDNGVEAHIDETGRNEKKGIMVKFRLRENRKGIDAAGISLKASGICA